MVKTSWPVVGQMRGFLLVENWSTRILVYFLELSGVISDTCQRLQAEQRHQITKASVSSEIGSKVK